MLLGLPDGHKSINQINTGPNFKGHRMAVAQRMGIPLSADNTCKWPIILWTLIVSSSEQLQPMFDWGRLRVLNCLPKSINRLSESWTGILIIDFWRCVSKSLVCWRLRLLIPSSNKLMVGWVIVLLFKVTHGSMGKFYCCKNHIFEA